MSWWRRSLPSIRWFAMDSFRGLDWGPRCVVFWGSRNRRQKVPLVFFSLRPRNRFETKLFRSPIQLVVPLLPSQAMEFVYKQVWEAGLHSLKRTGHPLKIGRVPKQTCILQSLIFKGELWVSGKVRFLFELVGCLFFLEEGESQKKLDH